MSRSIFMLLVAVTTLFCVVTSQRQCAPNEEWTSCGSACPPTCNVPPNQPCTLQCKIGCQCKEGYLKNTAGNCVLPQDC